MPRRKRAQESKRQLRRAVEKAEAEARAMNALASAGPLDDIFWLDHEGAPDHYYCCADCDRDHPDNIKWDAQREIDTYLMRGY